MKDKQGGVKQFFVIPLTLVIRVGNFDQKLSIILTELFFELFLFCAMLNYWTKTISYLKPISVLENRTTLNYKISVKNEIGIPWTNMLTCLGLKLC